MHAPNELGASGKIVHALNHAGVPVVLGDVSTTLALLPTAFSTSQIFQTFFKIMLLVMIFGLAHAVVYVPVVLYLLNPQTHAGHDDEETQALADAQELGKPDVTSVG